MKEEEETEYFKSCLKSSILLTWTWNLTTVIHLKQRFSAIVTPVLWWNTGPGSHSGTVPTGNTAR